MPNFFSLEEKKRKEINLILFYRYSPFRFIFVVVFLLLLTWAAAIERCHRDRIQHGRKPIVVVGIIAPAHSENRAGYYVRNDKKQSDPVSPPPHQPILFFFFFVGSTLIISSVLLLSRRCYFFFLILSCLFISAVIWRKFVVFSRDSWKVSLDVFFSDMPNWTLSYPIRTIPNATAVHASLDW